jgi:hypothetical protein
VAPQQAVTVLAEVRPGHVEALRSELEAIDKDDRRRDLLPFEDLPVHFARFVVIDESIDPEGGTIPAQLIFMSDIDGPLRTYLSSIVDTAGEGLDEIYRHCVGYPAAPTVRDRKQYLKRHVVRAAAAYINTVGRSVEQVRHDAELRRAIEDFLDDHDWAGQSPAAVRAAVQEFVGSKPSLRAALRPAPRPSLWWRMTERVHLVATVAVLVALLPLLLVVVPLWLVAVRLHEIRDVPDTPPPEPSHVSQLAEAEGHLVQNQFSAVGFVKPGWLRRATVSTVLRAVNLSSRHVFNHGNLAGIRTIHFARWIFLDGKRRMIFASNYDGSLESYMDDFIDKVAWGLNAAFSNGRGYPRTRWLVLGGARDEPAFKNFLRNHQIPTQIWYPAYGDLTAVNAAANAAIRDGLHGSMTDQQLDDWVARL